MNRAELLKAIEKEFGIGCAVICKERARQKEVKGYDVERDRDQYYKNEELAEAAVTYAIFPRTDIDRTVFWPWSLECWNPTPDNRAREFEKAGALLAAQLDVLNLS
ncbi:hypothetical protein [Zunongwangia profunda]|uniref:hypothetical protein n=1 Tax=Zunongwangia profunda TaxID=398743 RepID=UPI00248DFB3E|nr:hypothetical protein [Zunongwangia profunda]|tara:strand:- start:25816 stop:26133 length:318 start_codon:yes stop_codon:yes gene_type:complete